MRIAVAFLALALVSGCADPTAPPKPDVVEVPHMTQEGCQATPGCWDPPPGTPIYDGFIIGTIPPAYSVGTDPNPGANGIYAGLTDTDCYLTIPGSNPMSADLDKDKLWDECEYRLAHLFAPQLAISATDPCAGGEPYWSARWFDNYDPNFQLGGWGRFVRIAYLLSYYKDCGLGGGGSGAHSGDSEMITVQVTYNPNTKHWEFMKAFLTAHFLEVNSHTAWYFPGNLNFPVNALGYPEVWVSTGKHANYPNSNCGNTYNFQLDECKTPTVRGRVKVWKSHNVGGHTNKLIDCTASINPAYWNNNRLECFHSFSAFKGWQPIGGSASGYGTVMHSTGFDCFVIPGKSTDWCYFGPAGPSD